MRLAIALVAAALALSACGRGDAPILYEVRAGTALPAVVVEDPGL